MNARGRRQKSTGLTPWRGAVLGVVALALAASGYLTLSGRVDGGGSAPIIVSATKCAPGWTAPRSGLTVFTIKNTSQDTIYGIDLVGTDQVLVYGDIEMLAPGTEDQMDALLPPGDYSFQCESFSGATLDLARGAGERPSGYRRTPVCTGYLGPNPARDAQLQDEPHPLDGAPWGRNGRAEGCSRFRPPR